jgi:hypothetical protein
MMRQKAGAMTNTETVFNDVQSRAESIASDDERAIKTMDVGDEVRQGDVYLTMIKANPDNAMEVHNPSKQLAPGQTQGSRHCLRSLAGLKIFKLLAPGPLDGPIIVADQPFTVEHPEHGDRTLPDGTFAVTYQRGFSDELRPVAD